MRRHLITFAVAFASFGACASSPEPAPVTPVERATTLLPFDAPEGRERLMRAQAADFYALASHFEPQHHNGLCGPASAVAVLNALFANADPATKPVDDSVLPDAFRGKPPPPGVTLVFPRYTQHAFFDARFEKVKPVARFYGAPDDAGKRDPGLQLRQLGDIIASYGLAVQVRVVGDDVPTEVVRKEIAEDVGEAGGFVLVNYLRPKLGQEGGGHISPVVAYDAASDSILLLDVNPARAPWTWVPTEMLADAMRTKDTIENRGYLRIGLIVTTP